MNEQLQSALSLLIEKAVSGIDASVDFMQAELPEVIEQLLLWYGIKSFIVFSLCILTMIFTVAFVGWLCKTGRIGQGEKLEDGKFKRTWTHESNYGWGDPSCMLWICPLIFVNFAAVLGVDLEWLQIWIAPKIWLIEYAATLAK